MMRMIGLLVIFLAIPAVIAWINANYKKNRDIVVFILGLFLFFMGPLQINAALITNPVWPGVSKGMLVSLIDSLVVALFITNRKKRFKKPFLFLIFLFFVPTTLSMFVAFDKKAASFMVFQIIQMSFFYVVLSQELVRPAAMHNLLKGLACGLILNAGVVIKQKLTGEIQATGLTIHQNILGICVELTAIPILVAMLEGSRNRLFSAALFASLIIIAAGGSRGTMIFFTLGAIICLILSLARHATPRKWQILGIGAAACGLVAPLALLTIGERFGSNSVITDETVRADFKQAARWMAEDHPLGVGANNFVMVNNLQGYAARAGLPWGGTTRQAPAHNAFLLSRAEIGWAGEITLILLFGGVATGGYLLTFRLRRRPQIGLAIGSATAVTVVALHSNYEFAWYLSDVQRLFYANMAVIAACTQIAKVEARERKKSMRTTKPTDPRIESENLPPQGEIETVR